METSNIILSAIMASFCLLPFVVFYFNRKKSTRIMMGHLNQAAGQLKCEIQQFEISQNIIIGIDQTNKFLFFVKRKINEYSSENVNLSLMNGCRIVDQGTKVTKGSESQKRIERLDLEFEPRNSSQAKPRINFYNEDESSTLDGEVQLIRKWAQIANDEIKRPS